MGKAGESVFQQIGGRHIPVSLVMIAVDDQYSEEMYFAVVARDIRRRLEAEEQLERNKEEDAPFVGMRFD